MTPPSAPPAQATMRPTVRPEVRPTVRSEVRAAVAAVVHARLSATLLTATDDEKGRIALSRWLTPDVARELAGSARVGIRDALAFNRSTPADVLAHLAREHGTVGGRALTNPHCPFDAVKAHGWPGLTLTHADCPLEALTAALANPHARVHALAHPRAPLDVDRARTNELPVREQLELLRHPHLTHPDAVRILARHALREDASAADPVHAWAQHPNADPDWLADIAARYRRLTGTQVTSHQGDQVTYAVAANPATSADTLAAIVEWSSGHARARALTNPNCPESAMHAALDRVTTLPANRTSRTSGPADIAPAAVAANPSAPLEVLARIAAADLPADLARVIGDPPNVYDFTAAHARTPEHARVVLGLAGTWTLSVAELLEAGSDVLAPHDHEPRRHGP